MSRGPWLQVGEQGRAFFPLDPVTEDIHLDDIVPALSKLCRFNGHCRMFYSVAQHCVLVSRLVPEEFALDGLLHDAAEAYTGDITYPLKRAMQIELDHTVICDLFQRIERAVAFATHATWPMLPAVKHADQVALATEARDLMPAPVLAWEPLPLPFHERITPHPPLLAEALWWARYHELTGKPVPMEISGSYVRFKDGRKAEVA